MQAQDLIAELKRFEPTTRIIVRVTVGHACEFQGKAKPEQYFEADRVEPVPGKGIAVHISEKQP